MASDPITTHAFERAVAKVGAGQASVPPTLRLESLCEGLSLQRLHVGSYDDEGPTLASLHDEVMPAGNFAFNGPHHEIYLSDPRKTQASKLRTVLRQPVRRLA